MKKIKFFLLFFLLTFNFLVSAPIHAQSAPTNIYGSCGSKPSALENLFSNAEKIRQKCIDDAYESNKEKTRREIEELANTSNKLGSELKKVAIKSSVGLVQCTPRPGEPARDKNLIKRCEEIVATQNAVIGRMNDLSGWNDRPTPKANDNNAEKSITPPCPSSDKLNDLRLAATLNRKLFLTWEHCRAAMMDRL